MLSISEQRRDSPRPRARRRTGRGKRSSRPSVWIARRRRGCSSLSPVRRRRDMNRLLNVLAPRSRVVRYLPVASSAVWLGGGGLDGDALAGASVESDCGRIVRSAARARPRLRLSSGLLMGPLAGGIGILCWSIFGIPYRVRSIRTWSIIVGLGLLIHRVGVELAAAEPQPHVDEVERSAP